MENGKIVSAQPDKLRFDFIDLVFALAIGQVGIELGNFYLKNPGLFQYPYVITHLLLCIFIIASSWVGWNVSQSKPTRSELKTVFSVSFLVLLLDLLCVFCYYIMVTGVEKPDHCLKGDGVIPDSYMEVKWTAIIFVIYIIWDIFTKLITDDTKISDALPKYLERCWQAPVCFGLTCMLHCLKFDKANAPNIVVLTDITLLLIFILFRGLKSIPDIRNKIIVEKKTKVFIYLIGIGFPFLAILGILIYYHA